MAQEFGWDQTTRGIVLSSFFYGYLATQVLGGWLADRYGGKIVLGCGVLLWSLFTFSTPPAAAMSLTVLFSLGWVWDSAKASPFLRFTTSLPVGYRAKSAHVRPR